MNITTQAPLKWKVFIYVLIFCGLLLLILWLFQTVFLDAFYRRIKISEVKSTAAYIEREVQKNINAETLAALAEESGIQIELLATDGTLIFSSQPPNPKVSLTEKAAFFSAQLSEHTTFLHYMDGYDTLFSKEEVPLEDTEYNHINRKENQGRPMRFPPMQSILYAARIVDSNEKPLLLFISTVISPVYATITTLRSQLIVITIIMILLAIILAFIISKRVSKPIEDINNSAKVLATGIYNVHFNGSGFLEICELSDTLNTAAAELCKVETLRKELLANISHDLRTPLALIYGYAEMMHDFPKEVLPEQTQTIMDEAKRLSSLVTDVLDISKLEAGMEHVQYEQFSLTENVHRCINSLNSLIKKDGYLISFDSDCDCVVQADRIKIMQALYNLLINAVHYTGENKHIHVTQCCDAQTVQLAVIDNGAGIAENDVPYIWERYYKIDRTHTRPITGTGLGLSIVKKVIDLHGGTYGVQSTLGKGSTFYISIPRLQ